MRNLKFISLMIGCLAAVCLIFTSCDDDDDNNNSLTPQEQEMAFNAVRGAYSGKMLYATIDSKTGKQKTDSVAASWSIPNDSLMTINHFPISLVANSVSDSTLSKAIKTIQPVDMKAYIGFIRVTPATFLINPITPEFNLNYGGKDHKVQIPFYVNTYYSYGQLNGKQMQMQIIAGAIYVDGAKTSLLKNTVAFGFVSNK